MVWRESLPPWYRGIAFLARRGSFPGSLPATEGERASLVQREIALSGTEGELSWEPPGYGGGASGIEGEPLLYKGEYSLVWSGSLPGVDGELPWCVCGSNGWHPQVHWQSLL